MKKTLFVLGLIMAILMVGISVVNAADATVDLRTSSETVKPGDTFTVILSAKCEDGINGIDTKFSYDTDKLEFVKKEVANSDNWSNLGGDGDITVICNSTDSIKTADIYVLTFKVKDSVADGATATISTDSILLDSDAATNSTVSIAGKTATVKAANSATPSGNNGTADEGSNGGADNKGTGSGESTSGKAADPTTAAASGKTIPDAGLTAIKGIIIVGIATVGVVAYKKFSQLKEIK